MSGRLIVRDKNKSSAEGREPKFLRVVFYLKSGRELHFEDMRVFGRLWYKPRSVSWEKVIPTLAELGVEPLEKDMDGKHLAEKFANKSLPIKSALLDQRLIAGVGNIYADESLFLSKIHPLTPAKNLKGATLEKLSINIKQVLERSIASGGSTLRDYSDSDGVNGNYQHEAYVYGRTDKPCLTCGELIARLKIGGRSSHYCPHCQPKPKGVKTPLVKVRTTPAKKSANVGKNVKKISERRLK